MDLKIPPLYYRVVVEQYRFETRRVRLLSWCRLDFARMSHKLSFPFLNQRQFAHTSPWTYHSWNYGIADPPPG